MQVSFCYTGDHYGAGNPPTIIILPPLPPPRSPHPPHARRTLNPLQLLPRWCKVGAMHQRGAWGVINVRTLQGAYQLDRAVFYETLWDTMEINSHYRSHTVLSPFAEIDDQLRRKSPLYGEPDPYRRFMLYFVSWRNKIFSDFGHVGMECKDFDWYLHTGGLWFFYRNLSSCNVMLTGCTNHLHFSPWTVQT